MWKPGTLIAVKPQYREPEEEAYVCMVLDQDWKSYTLRYKILKPDATIGYINISAISAYEEVS